VLSVTYWGDYAKGFEILHRPFSAFAASSGGIGEGLYEI